MTLNKNCRIHSNDEVGLHSPSSWVRLDWRCKTLVMLAICCVGDVGDWDGEPSSASWLRVSAERSMYQVKYTSPH